MMICDYWAKGYADATGTTRIELPMGTTRDDAENAVRRATGGWGKVYSFREKTPAPVASVDPAYARMMSRHDNS